MALWADSRDDPDDASTAPTRRATAADPFRALVAVFVLEDVAAGMQRPQKTAKWSDDPGALVANP
jgi:hypothetical protein